MAREPEIKRHCRDVTCVRELDKGASQPELHKVPVERDTFDPAEDIREIRRRRPDCLCDVGESYGIGEGGLKEFFRPSNQTSRRSAGLPPFRVGLERQTKDADRQLVRSLAAVKIPAIGLCVCARKLTHVTPSVKNIAQS